MKYTKPVSELEKFAAEAVLTQSGIIDGTIETEEEEI